MEESKYYCNDCKTYFARKSLLAQHLTSRKHLTRTVKSALLSSCLCGKSYSHKKSLEYHKKTCDFKPITNKTIIPPADILLLETIQKKLELCEKEHDEMKAQIAMLIADKKSVVVNDSIVQVVREKRKKINKDVRQQIVEKQGNTCGECKLVLSAYFQIDHIIGLQFGGTDEESNLMALCCECHAIKSIAENQCRKQIKDAIQTILSERKTK
jgi:hypothetical protein